MPVTSGMFLFEVVIEAVNSLVESKNLVIKSDFADIFSLELRDPKQMYIVMPEPLPPPPDPPGKKKKKPPKPKKGKKGKEVPPPPEPVIQSGQSVLFGSTAEFLIENMLNCPLEVSLWSKEDNLTYIGSVAIPWDPQFITFLKLICKCQEPPPTIVRDDYNIFQEGIATLMAKIGLQVKLSYLKNKVTCSFRTLSEDINSKKFLYTGMNSKTTSYMCTMKTTDEDFEENCNKIENQYIVDKPKAKAIAYANYQNAPGANLTFFKEGDYCCMNKADKPPSSKYQSPETCPDIDSIIDYVRRIIVSCNDQMRMLTPRPTITPRIKATDIDRRCYCKETAWPPGEFSERFRREAQSGPCPICVDAGQRPAGNRPVTFDIANIRGPCGRPECKIARYLRSYIEKLVDEDNEQFNINDLVGPCGSEECTLAVKIKEFLRHEGAFTHENLAVGLSTQCACVQKMQEELCRQESCASACEHECEIVDSQEDHCMQPSCPYDNPDIKRVYNVYYFTVEHDFDKDPSPPKSPPKSPPTPTTITTNTNTNTGSAVPSSRESSSEDSKSGGNKFKYCGPSCPSVKFASTATCSKAACACNLQKVTSFDSKCTSPVCDTSQVFPPSPADSNVVIKLKEIYNPCCVKSCDIVEKVKDFIDTNVARDVCRKKVRELEDVDPCYCDCVCNFHFTSKTTYCPICGGYECLGEDMKDIPPYAMPHPCPIYHKLYDKKYINVTSPWPDQPPPEETKKEPTQSKKMGSKPGLQKSEVAKSTASTKTKSSVYDKEEIPDKVKQKKQKKKEGTKSVTQREEHGATTVDRLTELKNKYLYPPVPADMGWNWKAEDIPALKFRPLWKPGAAHKNLVRKYKAAKEGTDTIAKKKRLMMKGKKKLEMKPTLVVTKHDGEYIVQMEVFKKYSKERLVYQYPYDEKPPLIYTIGKTDAERMKIQAHRDRKARRETRRKCRLLQSTFRDKCQEICLKAYNQAIGVLPLPNPNNPECPCQTAKDASSSPIIDSCSCSEEGSISSSDTDNDEWTIEFTPPLARWDVKAKHALVFTDSESQYNYLDYKVKILDKNGNQVPRFFKSHEGKTECSDLGGFWGPGKVWLEINKDGYIGPDGRWIPMNFTGPDGLQYSAEEETFTDSCGQVLKPGVDGYIDKDLNWVWYSKRKQYKTEGAKPKAEATVSTHKKDNHMESTKAACDKGAGDKAGAKEKDKKVVIAGAKTGTNRNRNQTVLNLSYNPGLRFNQRPYMSRWDKKSSQDFKKIAKYREIMKQLEMYEDLGETIKPVKYNRASNYPSKKPSRIRQDTFKMTPSLLRMDGENSTSTRKSSSNSRHRY